MHMIIQLDSNHQIWEYTECYSLLSFVFAQMDLEREEGVKAESNNPEFPFIDLLPGNLVVGVYL